MKQTNTGGQARIEIPPRADEPLVVQLVGSIIIHYCIWLCLPVGPPGHKMLQFVVVAWGGKSICPPG